MRWPHVQLADVAQIVMGQSPPGETYNDDSNGLPFFQGKSDFGEQFPATRKWCSAPSRIAEAGDILLSVRAPVGPTNTARERCCIGRGLAAIRANPAHATQGYLRFFFKYHEPVLSLQGQGSTFAAIKRKEVAWLELPLPPLSEQRRIVEILDQADRLHRLRAEADAKADRILPALFIKMFGDPATNPSGYEVGLLGRVADVQGGLQLTSKRAGNPLEIAYLRVANVYRGRLDLTEIKTLPITEQELRRTRLVAGDILAVEGHGNPREVGRCAIWDGSIDPCVHQNHLIRLRTSRHRMTPEYVAAFLNSTAGRQHLLRAGKTTSGLNTISVSNVKRVEIFAPPLQRQREFSSRVAEHAAIERMLCHAELRLGRLWTVALDHAFSGDLTASWREAHMKELLQEMEQHAKALAEVAP